MNFVEYIIKESIDDTIKNLDIDWDNVDYTIDDLKKGIEVEKEHKDITKGDLTMTAKIALAHLNEFPDYYEALEEMEEKLKKEE
jgi:hypothetical protein